MCCFGLHGRKKNTIFAQKCDGMQKQQPQIAAATRALLLEYAAQYETREFLDGDPSWFMHRVSGADNQEAMAFVASTLSYGSRKQFMPKIGSILEHSQGQVHDWVREKRYAAMFRADDTRSFYRLYTYQQYARFLDVYSDLMSAYGTLGGYVRSCATTGYEAVEAICNWFSGHGVSVIVPKDASSACKRVCMFLRWMVRTGSAVDLGLWDFIDRRTLVMPLDTHVMQQSAALGLIASKSASMSTAMQLTDTLRSVFPDDPLRADFALFGYGVNHANQ